MLFRKVLYDNSASMFQAPILYTLILNIQVYV